MRKPWSISTTVRNPERLRGFLKVLKEIEGEEFDKENQIKYQILLIKNKLYMPLNIPENYRKYYEEGEEIPYNIAEDIFYLQNYTDPPMRGRQSVNPLNKLGFCIARQGLGKVKITDLGKLFLENKVPIDFIFFKSLLKLQFPNMWSKDFGKKDGFNIVPFIAVLRLINELNNRCNKKGLSKEEFCLFVPTFINIDDIEVYVEKIVNYRKIRKENKKERFIKDFLIDFYRDENVSITKYKNLFDYGDNIMRYFRLTGFFKIISDPLGKYWRIDIEPLRKEYVNQLLSLYSGRSAEFKTIEEYLEYISDISLPVLPWEQKENILKIAYDMKNKIKNTLQNSSVSLTRKEIDLLEKNVENLSVKMLNRYVEHLKNINRKIHIVLNKQNLKYNVDKANELISILKNKKVIKGISPEMFEKMVSDSLKIINDEIEIRPNYITDDNGYPISHASGGNPDIECYYKSFSSIYEVTLNTSNYQWIQEGQPVMRHLREFEIRNKWKDVFCVFVAPKIHKDTYSQFWFSVRYEYDGKPQKIVPLTTDQFVLILEKLLMYLREKKKFEHHNLYLLYDNIVSIPRNIKGFSDWVSYIDSTMYQWLEDKL